MSQIDKLDDLISRFLNQDRTALARIITLVENDPDLARKLLSKISKTSHESFICGFTGSPGTGRSR